MVLAGDLHHTGAAAGMVEAAVAVAELVGASPQGKAEDLMAEADAEHGQVALLHQAAGQINAAGHSGGITRAIGEEHALGFQGQHLLERGRGQIDREVALHDDHTAFDAAKEIYEIAEERDDDE